VPRIRYYSKKRRAIYAMGEEFTHLEIFERDGWMCGLCHTPVDQNLRYPNLLCATLDHIVPLAEALEQGWEPETIHTRANVQTAHLYCNLSKSGHCPSSVEFATPAQMV